MTLYRMKNDSVPLKSLERHFEVAQSTAAGLIVRAAVADPPCMILDEATSSIDTRTESLVQDGMDNLMEGRTVCL